MEIKEVFESEEELNACLKWWQEKPLTTCQRFQET